MVFQVSGGFWHAVSLQIAWTGNRQQMVAVDRFAMLRNILTKSRSNGQVEMLFGNIHPAIGKHHIDAHIGIIFDKSQDFRTNKILSKNARSSQPNFAA